MNIAIGSKTFGRNSRFGFGLLIAGLSVAAISLGIWQATDSGSTRTVVEPVSAPAAARPVEPATRAVAPVHYYLVNSEEQAMALAEADFESRSNYAGTEGQFPDTHVIDLSTLEGEAQYRALQEDLYLASTQNTGFEWSLVQFHDLTVPAKAIPSAGSFSTDISSPTVYIIGSEAEKQALLQEADVAAAVEGSSAALPNVMVVGSPEQESVYTLMLYEVMTLPEPTTFVDLR